MQEHRDCHQPRHKVLAMEPPICKVLITHFSFLIYHFSLLISHFSFLIWRVAPYTMPCASMALATFMKPATLAPLT